MNVYVSDFGFARQKENKNSKGFTKNNMGPVKWEAPESLQHKEYSEKTDAFSYAVCLYEMVAQRDPWEKETHAQVAYQVCRKKSQTSACTLDIHRVLARFSLPFLPQKK